MRIFTDGAEMQDVLFWDASTRTVIGTPGLYSPYYYSIYESSGNGYGRKNFSPLSELYLRFRFYHGDSGRSSEKMLPIFRYDTTSVAYVRLENDSSTHVHLYIGGVDTVDSGFSLPYAWTLIEMYYKIADAGGRFVMKVDGTNIIDYTGDTQYSSYTTFNNVYFQSGNGIYIDDLALNSTDNSDGKNDNSWCGDGVVIRLTPSGSSATENNWLNSGSVSGSANYLYVDEYPNDGDTTYIYASASSTGLQTQFALSNFTVSGTTITRIWAEGRAKKLSANPYGVKIGQLAEGGTDVLSGSQVIATGAYSRIVGNEAKINPVTSASWTQADVNGLELGLDIP